MNPTPEIPPLFSWLVVERLRVDKHITLRNDQVELVDIDFNPLHPDRITIKLGDGSSVYFWADGDELKVEMESLEH